MRQLQAIAWTAGVLALTVSTEVGAEHPSDALEAQLARRVPLEVPVARSTIQQDSSLICFESLLTAVLNPGCFVTDTSTGDCISSDDHFFVQYFFPEFETPHRVVEIAFISNDGNTVFPSAGVLLLPGDLRFPTPEELASLQVQNIETPGDTSVVVVDLLEANLIVESGQNVALVVALQFPEGGTLQAPMVGPGIAADEAMPDADCDFLTTSAGTGGWYAPAPEDPLDWGFEVVLEPYVAIESLSWSNLKRVYRAP